MKNTGIICKWFGAAVIFALVSGSAAIAQDNQAKPTLSKDKQQQQSSGTTLSLDNASTAPGNADEDAALKALQAMPEGTAANVQAKLQTAEDFLQKYPQSRYRPVVYSYLTVGYI